MQVECDIILATTQRLRGPQAITERVAHRNDIHAFKSVQNGRDPVFKQDIDLGLRSVTAERDERWRGQHSIADRAELDHKDAFHMWPIDRLHERVGRWLTRFYCFRKRSSTFHSEYGMIGDGL